MDLVEALRLVKLGRANFSPNGQDEESLQEFQRLAKTLVHAEKNGLVERCVAIKDSMRGQLYYRGIVVSGGLTYSGEKYLEEHEQTAAPSDEEIWAGLLKLQHASIRHVWKQAIQRRKSDPAGAITLARTLIETVCKQILDHASVGYPSNVELHALYKLVSERLGLNASDEAAQPIKQILGGCSSVISGLGNLRNLVGDAHGRGVQVIAPSAWQAELAVNLAGAMALFLVSEWEASKLSDPGP